MPELEKKAKVRVLAGEKKKAPKLIIGTADHSTSSFVEEQTIPLKDVGPRGGTIGATIGSRQGVQKSGRLGSIATAKKVRQRKPSR